MNALTMLVGLFSLVFCANPPLAAANPSISLKGQVLEELFPVFAKLLADGNTQLEIPPLVTWKIRNQGNESVTVTLMSQIAQWTPVAISKVVLGPGDYQEVGQTPFGPNLLRINSEVPAALATKVLVDDKVVSQDTRNIRIRAADDMIWGIHNGFDMEYLIAAWVTPKDPWVEQILGNARKKIYLKDRALIGYDPRYSVRTQVRAIFEAVRDAGVGYVNSNVNFGQIGFCQRVRLPRESLQQKAANCIDGAVLFASLFENIGLEPIIFLMTRHAFVGVRNSSGSNEVIFIETTQVGRSKLESFNTRELTFDAAARDAWNTYVNARNAGDVREVDIMKARQMGIYPLW
jgi:hypothetical protein